MPKKLVKAISRETYIKRASKKTPVGMKLTRLGKIFKIKKYKAPGE